MNEITMNRTRIFSILLLAVFLLGGISFFITQCKPKSSHTTEDTNNPQTQNTKPVNVPDFNPDSAYVFVQKQVDFGPRIPNTPSQTKCAQWLTDQLKSYHAKVVVQDLKV